VWLGEAGVEEWRRDPKLLKALNDRGVNIVGRPLTTAVNTDPGQNGSSSVLWSLDSILGMLGERWQFWWVKKRIQQTWSELEAAGLRLRGGQTCSNWPATNRRKVTETRIGFPLPQLSLAHYVSLSLTRAQSVFWCRFAENLNFVVSFTCRSNKVNWIDSLCASEWLI
jgi:hypothetical protein